MNLRVARWLILPVVLALFSFRSPIGDSPELQSGFGMTPQQFWRTPFGSGPWASLAGDADGDGRADLLAVGDSGDSIIALARTSPQGKPLPDNTARASVGKGVVAISSGVFSPGVRGASVLTIFADGSIKVAWGMAPGSITFSRTDSAGQVPSDSIPQAPSRSAVADFDGDGKLDVLVLDRDSRLLLLRNITDAKGAPKFAPNLLHSNLVGARRFTAGTLGAEKRARVVWLDATGSVNGAFIDKDRNGGMELGSPKVLAKAHPDDHIAIGRFRGAKGADLLSGQKLLLGGDSKTVVELKGVPPTNIAKDDGVWEVADIDSNGKDDLIRHREGTERFGGQDVYVHFSYDNSDAAKGFYCSANDGLLDAWKLGKIKPGGLDLAAIGCKVGRRDIIIQIERFDNEPEERLRANLDRVVKYFASLPVRNPDGSTGISVHLIYRTPWPLAKKDEVNAHFDELFPSVEHRGIVHSMFTTSGGPLVSQICGDHGKSNEGWAEFLHEFGHQLNLRHDGFYPSQTPGFGYDIGCALYPSLMSYSYSYTLEDRHDRIGYSDGSFVSYAANERSLSEKMPFPIEKLRFLAGGPYRFKIKAGADGKTTHVDWNWNGVFDDQPVVADINYGHGVDLGTLHNIGKTETAPALVAHGEGPNLTPIVIYSRGSQLISRAWMGTDRDTEGGVWTDEVLDISAGLIGDPTATYLGGTTWLTYPTAKGVVIRPVNLSGVRPSFGPPSVIPNTTGVQPTIVSFGGRLALLSWRSKNSPVGLSIFRVNGTALTLGGERSLDIVSDVPVGAVAGPKNGETASLYLARIQSDGKENAGRNELVRYEIGADGFAKVASRSWISGTYARYRMTLLWRPESGFLPDGRLYQFTGGNDPAGPSRQQWITLNVPYADVNGGWLFRRYHNAGFTSPSAPGAIFFKGSILYAVRLGGSNDLNVAFYADGATPTPLGDFDDIGHICDYGLSRSIKGLLK